MKDDIINKKRFLTKVYKDRLRVVPLLPPYIDEFVTII
jgi:hypothetical protein